MSDRSLRHLTRVALAWWLAAGIALGYGANEIAHYDPPPPVAYPIGQPGATPMAWPGPTRSVPTAVPIWTGEPSGWVNCESRTLETPVIVCEPDGGGGY